LKLAIPKRYSMAIWMNSSLPHSSKAFKTINAS